MKRKTAAVLLAAAMLCAMVPAAARGAAPAAGAAAQYRAVLSQADTYDYQAESGTVQGYRYALVQMAPGDAVPTLLLEQQSGTDVSYDYYAKVFRYSPETGSVASPAETLYEGGFASSHYGLSMEGDGNGIRETGVSGGTGLMDIARVTLEGDTLKREEQWSGMMGAVPEELTAVEIDWHDLSDLSPLDSLAAAGTPADQGHIYDAEDPGTGTVLQPRLLDSVHDQASAVEAVRQMLAAMTPEQKQSPAGADLAALFAEEAAARAAARSVTGGDILINRAAVQDLEGTAASAAAAVENALIEGGVSVARKLSNTVTLVTSETGPVSFRIDPDILTASCDRIRIQTPAYAFTLRVEDLAPDLNGILTFQIETVSAGTVKVTMPGGALSSPATLAVSGSFESPEYQAVIREDGTAVSSKYNPATGNMEGKVTSSGSYTVRMNRKDFTDISGKSAEMQNAVRVLASKGIIAGTTETTFSPDGTISRAEIAKLLVFSLGWADSSAVPTFTDVPRSSWYSGVAAVSQQRGLISGYPDNTFRGTAVIPKDQIVVVCGRVLEKEMKYKVPADPQTYLAKYRDTVAKWAQPEVALCTRENLVLQRYDGCFSGTAEMTRGDAAIIIFRLYQRLW